MEITVLYERKRISKEFITGWGISFLVDRRIIFDTGGCENAVVANLAMVHSTPAEIEAVVISHDHWDHIGGLGKLLEAKNALPVYVCPHVHYTVKETVARYGGISREADTVTAIRKDIFVTGEIAASYKGTYMPEQALIVTTRNGVSIITGCSHPGIVHIVQTVKEYFAPLPLDIVMGGFHLKDSTAAVTEEIVSRLKALGVCRIAPLHCTGARAERILQRHFGGDYISLEAGSTVML